MQHILERMHRSVHFPFQYPMAMRATGLALTVLVSALAAAHTIAQDTTRLNPDGATGTTPASVSDSNGERGNIARPNSSTTAERPTTTRRDELEITTNRRGHRGAILVGSLTIFALAVFVGFELITKVPPTLHTPLMSGSNAISGITIVGAIVIAGNALGAFGSFLGLIAVILATINVVGGFLVTHRMLMMFKKR
jgi:H+-translocating NAD(P) transhydrogenase subunit alpha